MSDRRKRVRWARRIAVFAPAVIVVIFGALSFGVLRRSLETRDLVSHTRQVLSTSTELLTALLDAETAERGYLLTRDTTFLDPFEGASPRVDSLLAQLGVLIRDSPRQRARIDTLDQYRASNVCRNLSGSWFCPNPGVTWVWSPSRSKFRGSP